MATKNNELRYDGMVLKTAFEKYAEEHSITKEELNTLSELNKEIQHLDRVTKTFYMFDLADYEANQNIDLDDLINDLEKFDTVMKYKPMVDMIAKAKTDSDINLNDSEITITDVVQFLPTYHQYVDELIAKYNSLEEAQSVFEKLQKSFEYREEKLAELEKLNERKAVLDEKHKLSLEPKKLFENFLKENKLSTTHASDIYDFITNGKDVELNSKSYRIRKLHPIRDRIIKKGVIPTAVTSSAIGATVGVVASQSLIAGSTTLGFLPVYGSLAMTTFVTATIGAVAGLITTPAIIFAKNKLTKLHYNIHYKNATKNLEEFEAGTDIQNLPIVNLMNKIEASNHKLLSLNEGNAFTKIFKFLPKHILNAVNRNRLHHLEKFTKDLVQIHTYFPSDKTNELLTTINNFIGKDVEESKLHAMLTCKKKGKHIHKTIENIDIYANLKIYLDTVNPAHTNKEIKKERKLAKTISKNLRQKTFVANKILNGESLLSRLIQEKSNNFNPTPDNSPIFDIDPETIVEEEPDVKPEFEVVKSQNDDIVIENEGKTAEEILTLSQAYTEETDKIVDEINSESNNISTEEITEDEEIKPSTIKNPKRIINQIIEDSRMKVELESGKRYDFDADKVRPVAIDSISTSKGNTVITYEDGIKTNIFPEPVEAGLRTIEARLRKDPIFISAISTSPNYNLKTFNNLTNKLHDWSLNATIDLKLTPNEKKLLNAAFKEYNASIKEKTSYTI